MFDYKTHFNQYCKDHNLDLMLSFNMPAGYETAYGTFDPESRTVFINAEYLSAAPDYEKAFYLFHELRHSSQHLCPELFSSVINRSLQYVIMYNGTCYKRIKGKYHECILTGGEEYFTNIYLGQPYEVDANTYAYRRVKDICGDSEGLQKLYEDWLPNQTVSDELYNSIFAKIDEKLNLY